MPKKIPKRQRLMKRVDNLMLRTPPEEFKNLSVNWVAQKLEVSPECLTMACKRQNGYSIGELIMHYKTNIAANMINRDPDIPVKNIVIALDISSSSYLARMFRKQYNMTPTQYREFSKETARRWQKEKEEREKAKEMERKRQKETEEMIIGEEGRQ